MAKRVMKWKCDVANGTLTVTVDGVTEPLTVDCAAVDEGFDGLSEIGRAVFVNGVKQKAGDAAAGLDTAQDKMAAVRETVDMLLEGKWGRVKKAAQRATDLVAAIMVVKGLDEETATEKVLAVEKDIWGQWEKHPAVASELAKIDSARATEKEKTAKAKAKDTPTFDFDTYNEL